jgi:hypothetical protein
VSNNRPGLLRTLLGWMWRHKLITAIALVVIVLIAPTDETTTAVTDAGTTATEAVKDAAEEATEPEPSATVTETVTEEPTPTETPTAEPTEAPAADGTALAALATLEVKGRAPMTGYDRALFGPDYSDAARVEPWGRNGCDSRNDALARDLQRETVESNGCVVTSGVLAYEPYTGARNVYFDKHDGLYETDLDYEHIVSLGNAFATGAQQWTPEKREEFANIGINILMTDPSQNRSKGDSDFATWLPPNKAFRCSLAARQIRVKAAFELWVTPPEKAAFERVLATCPDEPLDQPDAQAGYTVTAAQAEEAAANAGVTSTPTATPTPTPTKTPTQSPTQAPVNVYYENCDAVRAAGAAPIRTGDPGYGSHLDRDGDGIACE